MRIRFNPLWLLVSVLAFSLQLSRAQIDVPPTISFDLGGSNAPDTSLWDLNGTYNLSLNVEQRNGLETPMALSFELIQDAKGNLTGNTNDFQELDLGDNSFFAVSYVIHGKVTGTGGGARVHFTIHFFGNGMLAGQTINSMSGSLTVDGEVDNATGGLIMGAKASKFSVSFGRAGSLRGVADFSTDLPSGVDGTWNLSMQLAALSKISGTATITTPSEQLGMNLAGTFRNNLFKISAKGVTTVPGTSSGVGSSATIQLTPSFDTIQLKGKLLGQRLLFIFPEGD